MKKIKPIVKTIRRLLPVAVFSILLIKGSGLAGLAEDRVPAKLLPSSLNVPPALSENPYVKVLIRREAERFMLTVPFSHSLRVGKRTVPKDALMSSEVSCLHDGIQIGSQRFVESVVRLETADQYVDVDKRSYRGNLIIMKTPAGKMNVINEVRLEDYLKGVLPGEVSDKWPIETLKAQAVASRTFALFKIVERADRDFMMTSDVLSQMYVGKSSEKTSTNQAVDLTKGEVLLYQARLFPAFFHAACAGQTTRADFVWRIEPNPVLNGAVCLYCRGSKHENWKSEVSFEKIESQIASRGYTISPIKTITFTDYDPSGRARQVIIEHKKGRLEFNANDFRLFVGPDLIRSTRAFVEVYRRKARFTGKGWGHGVGMCQWGAKAQAESGFAYRKILAHYYPGSAIKRIYSSGFLSVVLPNRAASSANEPTLFDKAEQILDDWFG